MHPAGSVIGFTVASGAGYGMFAVIGLLASIGQLPADWLSGLILMFAAVALVTGGLLSSTFHLGHPERAWRAFSQWRSSWLPREGVAAVVSYAPAVIVGWQWVIDGDTSSQPLRYAGAMLFVMSIVTVFCTAMIYRSLKPIPAWFNGYTTPGYLLMAAASGLMLTAGLFAITGYSKAGLILPALIATLGALVVKAMYWKSLKGENFRLPTRESATGLTLSGTVRPLEDPHSSDNYLMKEMGFMVARKHAGKLRKIAMIAGFAVPATLALATMAIPQAGASGMLIIIGIVFMTPGLLAERWLFFAEARHAVSQYYRDRAA